MNKEINEVGIKTADIYLHFPCITKDEADELADYLEDENIEYDGATDIVMDLKQRIDKAINDIQTTFQIISEQPSRNVEEDNYILSRLESFLKTLGGDVDDE